MTYTDDTEAHSRVLTALFDSRDAAERAVQGLLNAGIPREHINLRAGDEASGTTTPVADKGFWEELKDLFLPEQDRYSCAEGLRRGGYLVSVRADEANYNRVIDLLDREGSVDMDARAATWKQEGWAVLALDRLAEVIAPQDEAFKYRVVPRPTLTRRRKDPALRLSSEESGRLARLAKTWAFAVEVWGAEAEAREFLMRPHPLLEGRIPVDLVLANDVGADVVENLLGSLQYSVAV